MRNYKRSFFVVLLTLFFVQSVLATETTVPNLSLTTSQGNLSLKNYHGQVIYIDFWASWCGPCRKSFPWMNEMHSRYGKQGLKIIAINVDSDALLAKEFLKNHPAHFTVAFDPDGQAAKQFQVKGMPSSYLVDRDGIIQSSHIGFTTKESASIEAKIKTLVK